MPKNLLQQWLKSDQEKSSDEQSTRTTNSKNDETLLSALPDILADSVNSEEKSLKISENIKNKLMKPSKQCDSSLADTLRKQNLGMTLAVLRKTAILEQLQCSG